MKKEIKEAIALIQEAQEKLETLIYDREEYHIERSDNWQESEKGQNHEEATEEIKETVEELSSQCDALERIEL